jgi:hypothetical protein
MASAKSAAAEYWRGDSNTIRGERRISGCANAGWIVGGSCAGGRSGGGCVGVVVGAAVGGLFVRVCCRCTRGAVRRMCFAVGLVDE